MKLFSKLRFIAIFTLVVALSSGVLAQTPTTSSLGSIFANKGNVPLSSVQATADAQKTTQPFHKSNGEETLFYDGYFKANSDTSKLALLSDDGTSVWIDGQQVLSRAGQGQGFNQAGATTFYPLSKTFVKDQIYHVRLQYTNTTHTGDADVDGISLWAYAGGGVLVDNPARVDKIQYRRNNVWVDVPTSGLSNICKDSSITFKAVIKPTNANWPTDKPLWSGDASGTGEITTVKFSNSGTRTVTATCVNTVTKNIVVSAENTPVSVSWSKKTTTSASADNPTTKEQPFVLTY